MNLDKFTQAYLHCALWSSYAPNGQGFNDDASLLDENYSIEDIAPEALNAAIRECSDFRTAAGALLNGWSESQAGHDFWLTRNGHGAGFWDRYLDYSEDREEWKANGEALSALCGWRTAFPERDLYIGDDGKIWGFGE